MDVPGRDKGGAPLILNMQDVGGIRKTGRRGTEILADMLSEVNKVRRVPIPLSELILGTNCGGSDGNTRVTPNPSLGFSSDLLVAHGGTTVLAGTPENYCGER